MQAVERSCIPAQCQDDRGNAGCGSKPAAIREQPQAAVKTRPASTAIGGTVNRKCRITEKPGPCPTTLQISGKKAANATNATYSCPAKL